MVIQIKRKYNFGTWKKKYSHITYNMCFQHETRYVILYTFFFYYEQKIGQVYVSDTNPREKTEGKKTFSPHTRNGQPTFTKASS